MSSYNTGGGGGNWSRGRSRGGWRGRRGAGRGNYFSAHRSNVVNPGGQHNVNTSSSTRPRLVQTTLDNINPSPYKGWNLYMTDEGYSDNSPTVVKVQTFEKYFVGQLEFLNKDDIEQKGSITVDYKDLVSNGGIQESIPSLSADVREMPEKILQCLGLAIHQVLIHDLEQQALALQQQTQNEDGVSVEVPPLLVSVPCIHARLLNYEPVTPLKNLKANYYGKFVSVKGTVVRVSNIKPKCTKMAFQCNTCGEIQRVILPEGKYTVPTKCPAADCRGRSFIPLRSSALTETVDWQTIKVQEIIMDDHREAGRIPRTVECELTHDLVDSCVPGDMVSVSGIVKVTSSEEGRGRNNKDKCMFLLYIYANSVNNSKGNKKGESNSGLAVDFTLKELYAIQAIQAEKNLFRLIIGSLCPAIYGHEMVKAGLVLGLFGGTQKFVNDKNRIPVRGDPHILVVGDPGLGKSQMLQAVSNIAPRGVYVCGNTTTTAGLTVTLTKESSSGDFALEAGALVLADQGCCCIDEFDKMANQHQALLEAMEQQSISIAKAGVVCSLPARTSILAAANPVGGHYNKAKTVAENLKMGSALLSRFDLVFILMDKPDEEMDCMLSEHVMALHSAGSARRTVSSAKVRRETLEGNDKDGDEDKRLWDEEKPLSERLKSVRGEAFDPIPHQLLRKYVGYSRKYVHPKLTPEAAGVLQKFYLELRRQRQGPDSTPITTRQLESLIRLTEARARLELREKATALDAHNVVEVMKYSMVDTYSDELGLLDFQRSQHGSGMSSRSQAKKFIAALSRIAEQTYNSLFTVQQMRQIARDASIMVGDFEDFIASLNNQSYLLKKGPRVYQLQTMS
ncbi:DNA helicase MCM8-like [Saccoglossus kowalevskii]|uniref:DNA helicase MCM8 n=1 Tax=Saccoglossus kowalevskii TaxID=10224 RepID=A0ABM0MQ54_SACKO|nr:PREDICTED: DNA helicase MCM8-like [Saccoglossus kowalevskii]